MIPCASKPQHDQDSVGSRSGVGRAAGSGGFFVDTEAADGSRGVIQSGGAAVGHRRAAGLQAVEDPLLARRRRCGAATQLLDTLETIKADLLVGRVSEGRLNQLMVLIGQARERNLPGLDAMLDDIELRARVELAKFGRYPAG